MEENNQDDSGVPETTETETEAVETSDEESIEDLRTRLASETKLREETEAKNKQLFERVKKAEAKPIESTPSGLSLADIHALRNVHEDDVERIEKFAKLEGLSIKEALKNDDLKAILEKREEHRTTAAAANVSNVRRGPSKVNDETLLENARAGKISDDDADIERIVAAASKRK